MFCSKKVVSSGNVSEVLSDCFASDTEVFSRDTYMLVVQHSHSTKVEPGALIVRVAVDLNGCQRIPSQSIDLTVRHEACFSEKPGKGLPAPQH